MSELDRAIRRAYWHSILFGFGGPLFLALLFFSGIVTRFSLTYDLYAPHFMLVGAVSFAYGLYSYFKVGSLTEQRSAQIRSALKDSDSYEACPRCGVEYVPGKPHRCVAQPVFKLAVACTFFIPILAFGGCVGTMVLFPGDGLDFLAPVGNAFIIQVSSIVIGVIAFIVYEFNSRRYWR